MFLWRENSKELWKQHFSFSQTFHSCFYNLIETKYFLFLKENITCMNYIMVQIQLALLYDHIYMQQ